MKEAYITEKKAGQYIERKAKLKESGGSRIIKLPHVKLWQGEAPLKPYYRLSDCSIDEETGEFLVPETPRFMKDNSSRLANPRQVLKSCNNFKWLIRANESKIKLFVTLTYAKNMTDTKQLYEDYRRFWQKLKYHYGDKIRGYLAAFEPQKRGAWHAHLLLLSDKPNLFIPNKRMKKIWGHGFTQTQSCRNIHDIGAYLTSYLTNLKIGQRTKKGNRLYMYPAGFRFLRSSTTVERVKVNRWFGDITKVDWNPLEYDLLYDYQNEYVFNDSFQIVSLTCLRKRGGP